jgi:hypothetical protein
MKTDSRRISRAGSVAVIAATAFFSMFPSAPARAIDAGEVMDKMSDDERSGFIAGSVDMAAHLYAMDGNGEKADCAVKWLFDDESSLEEIFAFFDAHKGRDAVGLLSVLINRHCGE